MKTRSLPTQQELLNLLSYNPTTGKLLWKVRDAAMFKTTSAALTWNKRFAGKEAFTTKRSDGYFGGSINYVNYLAHRVIYKMVHNSEPEQIDHDDRDRSNNRVGNLVDSSATKNSRNCKLFSNNTSGQMGVSWDAARSKWIASITVNYVVTHLGRFTDLQDAIAARKAAEIQHNFHPSHGV